MPRKTKTAHETNGRKRFEAPKAKVIDLSDAESESGAIALQTASKPKEPEWEGFGEEADEDEEEEEEDDSDKENIEDEEDEDEDVEMEAKDDIPEKDDAEAELERLVFGDSAGFREGISAFSLNPLVTALGDDTSDEEKGQDEDVENLEDQDLFFFDSGPTPAPGTSLVVAEEEEEEGDKPAWEDSDDDKLVISLASVPQLRKLREDEEDDMVNGKEYVRRLRKQYQRLYPTPNWAMHATGKSKRKRTRTMEDGESGDESASDMDVDEEDLSTQPLARLLKDADILSKNTARNPAKRRKLQAGTIDIQRLKDVCKNGPSAVTSLSFHPTYPLLLSSGPSSTLSLHHVNPNPPHPNPLLTSLHIKKTPLTTTSFHPSANDSRIFLSARRRYFHIWNVATGTVEKVSRVYGHQHEQRTMETFSLSPNGKYMALQGSSRKGGGVINVLDATTLQWVTQVRIESRGGVADFAWWSTGLGLVIAGKNGEVTEWSIKDGVVGRWQDEGAVGTTVIAVGGVSGRDGWLGGDRWVAVGSSSGVVNLYDRRAWSENLDTSSSEAITNNGGIPRAPKPLRALDNLTTPISHLVFSPDGQILCMASRWKHNAVRLVHLPSATVFRNWPTTKTPLGRVSSVAWGRPSEEEEKEGCVALMAVGNEMGRVRLWEVRA
ncbi:WD40 repeat-like protein [Pleomassaria siparia CBS 279.74]|uniref:WD40 repeat-like protein n=1 Tax=Pleomassaria siparia CBS 279.74 TaxID=1314801 RepID=A0A6G1KGC2_9PLEO|nr:WD40 repeat-like protein [Pleomassaria siparia CBS 279.74]